MKGGPDFLGELSWASAHHGPNPEESVAQVWLPVGEGDAPQGLPVHHPLAYHCQRQGEGLL